MAKKTSKKASKKAAKKVLSKQAGRPKGSGKFGCATKAVRIPIHLEDEVQAFVYKKLKIAAK